MRVAAGGHVHKGRQEVHQRDQLAHPARGEGAGLAHDHGHARGPLEEGLLVPHAPLAQHLAVIADEDDDGVVRQPGGAHRLHDAPDLVVDVGAHAVVGVPGGTNVLFGHGVQMRSVRVVEPPTVLVELLHRNRVHRRHVDVVVAIHVPVVRGGRERRVRVGEGDDQEERIVLRVPRQIVDFLDAVELDLVVVVDLQAAHALAGLDDRAEADSGRAVLRLVGPVRCPGEVGRVDVGGEPLLETMELVRADEVHLAAQDGAVAEQ